eukprot:7058922-Pyramimonas_sp.AAC.1
MSGMLACFSHALERGERALGHSRTNVCTSAMGRRPLPSPFGNRTSSLMIRSSGHARLSSHLLNKSAMAAGPASETCASARGAMRLGPDAARVGKERQARRS